MAAKTNGLALLLLCLPLLVIPGCGGTGTETPGQVTTSEGSGGTGTEPPGQEPDGGDSGGSSATGVVELSWDAPSENSDGSPLTDLARFRVYVGQTSPISQDSGSWVTVEGGTTHTFTDLSPGVYYFAVSAVNFLGAESALSNEVEKTVL